MLQDGAPYALTPHHFPGGGDDAVAPRDDKGDADAGGGAAVLIVEDDFLIGLEAESALRDAGYRVLGVVGTAEEALAEARRERPALVVMDIRLAGARDGVEAAQQLFQELGVRCLFATAHDDRDTRARAAPFAPLGWLAKPYTTASLVEWVRRGIASSGRGRG